MSWSSERQECIFCNVQDFFNIWVLPQCIVYSGNFIYTFIYHKTLLHTLLLLASKIIESLQCIHKSQYALGYHHLPAPPPSKTQPIFSLSPLINLQTVQAPLFRQFPPYILVFRECPLKIEFFNRPHNFSSLTHPIF